MTEDEIRSNISYNVNLIQEYTSQITVIKGEIEELETIRTKVSNYQFDFASGQERRRSGLNKFVGVNLNNNIFSKYIVGMSELLNGQEYTNANNGLTTIIERVQNKISEKETALSETENNLAYRKQRIAYWEEQLRIFYATKEG